MRLLFIFMDRINKKFQEKEKRNTYYGERRIIPKREGVYLALGVWNDNFAREIEVYRHPVKGLCCFCDDFGSSGTGADDSSDCHVSVQFTGLEFLSRLRDLD